MLSHFRCTIPVYCNVFFKGEVRPEIDPIFIVIRIDINFWRSYSSLKIAFLEGFKKRKSGFRGRAISGTKKVDFMVYGFSGLRKTLFWKNCLGIFQCTVRNEQTWRLHLPSSTTKTEPYLLSLRIFSSRASVWPVFLRNWQKKNWSTALNGLYMWPLMCSVCMKSSSSLSCK